MAISTDLDAASAYLDIDSTDTGRVLATVNSFLGNDTVVKCVGVFFYFLKTSYGGLSFTETTNVYQPDFPDSDLELFELIKSSMKDESRDGMLRQKFLERVDVKVLLTMPFESEKVQNVLAQVRKEIKEGSGLGTYEKIYKTYKDAINSPLAPEGHSLKGVEIIVVYGRTPNLKNNSALRLSSAL